MLMFMFWFKIIPRILHIGARLKRQKPPRAEKSAGRLENL